MWEAPAASSLDRAGAAEPEGPSVLRLPYLRHEGSDVSLPNTDVYDTKTVLKLSNIYFISCLRFH